MKLIEALKNLKTIEKRIDKNCEKIREYCAYVSVETPTFETEERQRQEVASLVQANLDLEKEYIRLKRSIEQTNLATKVSINGKEYTISELITIKGAVKGRAGAGRFRTATYQALNAQKAMQRLQQVFQQRGGVDPTNPAKVIPLWKEEDKNKALHDWEEFTSAIEGRLEVVNAETDLIEA